MRDLPAEWVPKRRPPRFVWARRRHWSHRSALYLEEPYTGVSAPRQAFKYPDPTTSRTKTATVEPLEVFARSFMLDLNSSEHAFMTSSLRSPGLLDLDLSLYQISPHIDFMKFSCGSVDLGLPSGRVKRNSDSSGKPILTLHDPRPEEIRVIAEMAPNAVLEELEVSLDFFPKKGRSLSLIDRHERLEQVRQWLVDRLYPWDAPGIQVSSRASKASGNVGTLCSGDVERRPYGHETLYLGHKEAKYACRDQPNFAFMRVYRKVTDNRRALPPDKHCCRIEVNLNREGCAHFMLQHPRDLRVFNYRELGRYFRLIRPQAKPNALTKLRRSHPKMAEVLDAAQARLLNDTLESVGAYAAGFKKSSFITSGRAAKPNDRLQQALKSLTRTWRKGRASVETGTMAL